MLADKHPGCEGCQHRNEGEGGWCYMFQHAPDVLPCAQHDMFEAEREVVAKIVLQHPILLEGMVKAAMRAEG